jgi:hypothetical protein
MERVVPTWDALREKIRKSEYGQIMVSSFLGAHRGESFGEE